MIYNLRHRTTYTYDAPVTFTQCVLRLTPQSSQTQTVTDHRIAVSPQPSQTLQRFGPFGEALRVVMIEAPHRRLVIEATSQAQVHTPKIAAPLESPAWEGVREAGFQSTILGVLGPATYLFPTHRTPIVADITDYGRQSFTPGRPIVDAAFELARRIRADFTYDPKATSVSTAPGEAFAAQRGVCQDFANIMICALRGLGLPAAYVSGYLRTVPPPGKKRLEGADATHAWVRLWCGEMGWVSFDPTNAMIVGDDHITLTIGRDYGDVAPIEGVMLASGAQALKVEVDVIPLEEPSLALRA